MVTKNNRWQEWVKTLSNSKNPNDTDLLIAKIKVLVSQEVKKAEMGTKLEVVEYLHQVAMITTNAGELDFLERLQKQILKTKHEQKT